MGISGITPTVETPTSFFPLGAETTDQSVGLQVCYICHVLFHQPFLMNIKYMTRDSF